LPQVKAHKRSGAQRGGAGRGGAEYLATRLLFVKANLTWAGRNTRIPTCLYSCPDSGRQLEFNLTPPAGPARPPGRVCLAKSGIQLMRTRIQFVGRSHAFGISH